MNLVRPDGRSPHELRPLILETGYLNYADGSCLARAGNTWVLCAATIERRLPAWLIGSGQGWITAEYALLPAAGPQRTPRETLHPRGRSAEIRRFIGRSLRAVCNLAALAERQIIVDCDVIQADGGTRTIAVTAGFCALKQAVQKLLATAEISTNPIIEHVAAVSAGLVEGQAVLDMVYEEDSRAEIDMNLVITESGRIVEIQVTAERQPFTFDDFSRLFQNASVAINELIRIQHEALGE
ncbi:MAG: ribonuclease PH [candidate division WOR-3 bacterium]